MNSVNPVIIGAWFNFALLIGIMNMVGGRYSDVNPMSTLNGRLIFRCILPGLATTAVAVSLDFTLCKLLIVWISVTAGSALWYTSGWSFDEITGVFSPEKYPSWLRRFGIWLIPNTNSSAANKLRGVIMKGVRGLFDVVTFIGLIVVNPSAPVFLLGCSLMGVVYWACGRIFGATAVLSAEFWYANWRAALIFMALSFNILHLPPIF